MRAVDVLVLTLVLAAALAWPLRMPPIAAHGEAREGLVVQDIVDRGAWVLPHRNGELPSKPPLFHWIAAAAARVAGVSDATVRAPSALAGWAMVLATYALGASLGGRVAAWLAVGALLGMEGFWTSAWEARVDMVFAAAITVVLGAFFLWYRRGGAAMRAVCWIGVGCAVLAKGPAGAGLPALVIAAFVLRESWRLRRESGPLAHARTVLRRFWSWPLCIFVVAVDAGWYVLAYRRGGADFLVVQLVHENVDRLVGRGVFGMHGGRSRFAMLIELATDLLPWNLALVACAVAWARGARADVGERFLHAWWLVVVAVFTAAYGKRDIYLLPLYPALALVAALVVARATDGATARIFGVVPVPAVARRRFGARAALACVALAIVVFDVTLASVSEITRLRRVHHRSLLGFAQAVEAELPADATLYAAPDVDGSDVQVLAYRLRRTIARADMPADGGTSARYYLVAATSAVADEAHVRRLAVSSRRGTNVALVAVGRW